jgi:hypothetical protein
MDPRRLAVHDPAGTHDRGTQGVPDALMSQAHAQKRDSGGEPGDDVVRDSSLDRRARPGRDNQVAGSCKLDVFERDLIVADDFEVDARVDLAKPLDEVVSEGIVIVDQENHCRRASALGTAEENCAIGRLIERGVRLKPELRV